MLCAAGSIRPRFRRATGHHHGTALGAERHPDVDPVIMPTVDHRGSSADFHPILAGIEVGIVVRSRTTLRICAEVLAMDSQERADRSTGGCDTGRFRNVDCEGGNDSLLSPLSQHHWSALRVQRHVHDDGTIAPLGHRSLFPADQNPVFPSLLSTEALPCLLYT